MKINGFKVSKFDIFLVAGFLSLFFLLLYNLDRKHKDNIEYRKEIGAKEINGKIILLKELSRGQIYIEIKTTDSIVIITGLPIAWEFKEYNIMVEDSMSKMPNNKIMIFYKANNGLYKEIFKYEISLQ